MKNKKYLLTILSLALIAVITTYGLLFVVNNHIKETQTQSVAVSTIDSTITADGTIHSQNEATVHFQTAGKLIYLPFKEGDSVTQGQTIAQIDPYPLQQQLNQTLNNYKSNRDAFDQGQDNTSTGAITTYVQRLLDQNQASLNNAVISVQLANYALQLSTLSSPINGVITHEDVTVANQNITTTTGFSLADPTTLVMRTNVSASDIDFISEGSQANVQLTGLVKQTFSGIITKIYPQKITLANGEDVYQVDITSQKLIGIAKLGQSGTVAIKTTSPKTMLIPSWAVIAHAYVWVLENNMPVLKQVVIGKIHGAQTEVISGLTQNDRVIANPDSVAAHFYNTL